MLVSPFRLLDEEGMKFHGGNDIPLEQLAQ